MYIYIYNIYIYIYIYMYIYIVGVGNKRLCWRYHFDRVRADIIYYSLHIATTPVTYELQFR